MKRAAAVIALVLVAAFGLAVAAPGAMQSLVQTIQFTDPLGNDALAAIVFDRDSSDNPELNLTLTSSDTEMYTFPGTLTSAITVGQIVVTCTVLEVAGMLDQSCFIADKIYTVTAISQIHTIKETATALTIMPTKQEGTEAPASGQDLLSTGFNALSTAQTIQNGALTSTGADLILAVGDRLGLDFTTGATGELQGVVVSFTLVPS